MANFTEATPAQVIALLQPTSLGTSDVDPYRTAATRLIEDHLDLSQIAADTLTEIHAWLSAHAAASRDAQVTEETVGPERLKYERTRYLDMAIALDPTGKLAEVMGDADDGRTGVSFHAGGK